MPIDFSLNIPYYMIIEINSFMTKKDQNLKEILENMPQDTPEITHVILKSQMKKRGYHKTLW